MGSARMRRSPNSRNFVPHSSFILLRVIGYRATLLRVCMVGRQYGVQGSRSAPHTKFGARKAVRDVRRGLTGGLGARPPHAGALVFMGLRAYVGGHRLGSGRGWLGMKAGVKYKNCQVSSGLPSA